MKKHCYLLTLIALLSCSPLWAQDDLSNDPLPTIKLEQIGEPIESGGYILTSVHSIDGLLYIAVLSQGERTVSLFEKDGTFLRRWSIKERGIPQEIASPKPGELFIGCGGPAVGYYFSLEGELLQSLKLFRNSSFTFADDESVHVSTFSNTRQNREGVGYWVTDRLGAEKLFVDVYATLDEEDKIFFDSAFQPFLQNEFVYMLDRYYPFLVKLDRQTCMTCHTEDRSPDFDYELYLERVRH